MSLRDLFWWTICTPPWKNFINYLWYTIGVVYIEKTTRGYEKLVVYGRYQTRKSSLVKYPIYPSGPLLAFHEKTGPSGYIGYFTRDDFLVWYRQNIPWTMLIYLSGKADIHDIPLGFASWYMGWLEVHWCKYQAMGENELGKDLAQIPRGPITEGYGPDHTPMAPAFRAPDCFLVQITKSPIFFVLKFIRNITLQRGLGKNQI